MLNATPSLRFLLGLTTAITLSLPAFAQDASTATPPARVGQIADVTGNVSYNGAGSSGQWVAATQNYPVTTGDSLFTQDGGQAALVLDASRVTLGPNTELQVTDIDADNFVATQSQGEVFVNLTDLQQGQTFTLNTPRGGVNITSDGEYDINAGDANDPTTVAVISGSATIGQLQVPAGQEGFLSGTDQTTAQLGALQRDDFMNQALAQLAPPPPPYAAPVVEQMTGASELSSYGNWDQSPQYGAVWYPSVDSGWAPYRDGHWAYVAPWGWTWVDVEPWGFAPFHYGRWIQDSGRWGWVPAAAYQGGGDRGDYRPVYAPAVVGFFGLGAGVAMTASVFASGNVGWVPLAPGEAYYPSYHVNRDYLQRINRVNVRNYTQIDVHNTVIINNYANRRAATYVPSSAMARGEEVSHYGHAVPDNMFAQARPVQAEAFNQALRPAIVHREAAAPRLTDFAQRHNVPPAVFSHEPVQFHPGSNGEMRPEMAPGFHPQPGAQPFRPQAAPADHPEATPGYHPEAAPAYHPQAPAYHPQAPVFHPQAAPGYHPQMPAYHPQEPVFHPQEPAYHPQMQAPADHPQEPAFHPQEPAYHPQMQAPADHPQEPAFHPQGPAYHPQMQAPQFHPEAAPRPQPHPEAAPRPNGDQGHRPQ